MEIYNFVRIASFFMGIGTKDMKILLIGSAIIGVVLWLTLFVLQGFGLYAMAKKQGLSKKWMAFVPFVNILYMGKLAGDCRFFGHKIKNAGVYAMIAQILATLVTVVLLASEMYLYIKHGAPIVDPDALLAAPYWEGLTGFDKVVSVVYDYGEYFMSIFQLICSIMLFVLMMGVYKKYAYKGQFLLSFLTLFVPISRFIIVFAIRNNDPVDYEEMERRRSNYYGGGQGYQGGNPYGNPYNNPYGNPYNDPRQNPYNNPYGNPYGNPYNNPYNNPYGAPNAQQQQQQQPPKQPEDPFEEFASQNTDSAYANNGGTGEPKYNDGGNSDGFFD